MSHVALFVALLAVSADAIRISHEPNTHQMHHKHHSTVKETERNQMVSVPMTLYKQDCWKKHPVPHSILLQTEDKLPGAGLGEVVPFQTVLKDGFFAVDCAKDAMLHYGDKFGNNKFSYNQKQVSNVSVVRYSEVVPKLDQKSMSHAVCFAFCRTVPEMLFFGVANGRDCYCAPYYKPMVDDDSMCDAVCDGDKSTMCGGSTKSSMFEMHTCETTGRNLADAASLLTELDAKMTNLSTAITDMSDDMQAAADNLQKVFGSLGNPEAADLMQSAKQFAGKLDKHVWGASEINSKMQQLTGNATQMSGSDFSNFAAAQKAEALTTMMETLTSAETGTIQELEELLASVAPEAVANASGQYYPIMYFVDKSFDKMQSTCSGTATTNPILGSSDACAAACDTDVGDCVGFSYFASIDVDLGGLCFLFSKFDTLTYYTGCPTSTALDHMCFAKLSDFEGTTLKPDPSGKCKECVKKATNANRCPSLLG